MSEKKKKKGLWGFIVAACAMVLAGSAVAGAVIPGLNKTEEAPSSSKATTYASNDVVKEDGANFSHFTTGHVYSYTDYERGKAISNKHADNVINKKSDALPYTTDEVQVTVTYSAATLGKTRDNPIVINSYAEWVWLCNNTGTTALPGCGFSAKLGGSYKSGNNTLPYYYYLNTDIDFTVAGQPIVQAGYCDGVFYGGSHTFTCNASSTGTAAWTKVISTAYQAIGQDNNTALFCTTVSGYFSDITVKNFYYNGTVLFVSGITGQAWGTARYANCVTTGNITHTSLNRHGYSGINGRSAAATNIGFYKCSSTLYYRCTTAITNSSSTLNPSNGGWTLCGCIQGGDTCGNSDYYDCYGHLIAKMDNSRFFAGGSIMGYGGASGTTNVVNCIGIEKLDVIPNANPADYNGSLGSTSTTTVNFKNCYAYCNVTYNNGAVKRGSFAWSKPNGTGTSAASYTWSDYPIANQTGTWTNSPAIGTETKPVSTSDFWTKAADNMNDIAWDTTVLTDDITPNNPIDIIETTPSNRGLMDPQDAYITYQAEEVAERITGKNSFKLNYDLYNADGTVPVWYRKDAYRDTTATVLEITSFQNDAHVNNRKDCDEYVVRFTPKGTTRWKDGTQDTKTITVTIIPKKLSFKQISVGSQGEADWMFDGQFGGDVYDSDKDTNRAPQIGFYYIHENNLTLNKPWLDSSGNKLTFDGAKTADILWTKLRQVGNLYMYPYIVGTDVDPAYNAANIVPLGARNYTLWDDSTPDGEKLFQNWCLTELSQMTITQPTIAETNLDNVFANDDLRINIENDTEDVTYKYSGVNISNLPAGTASDVTYNATEHCFYAKKTGTYNVSVELNNTNTMIWPTLDSYPKTITFTISKAELVFDYTAPSTSGGPWVWDYAGTETFTLAPHVTDVFDQTYLNTLSYDVEINYYNRDNDRIVATQEVTVQRETQVQLPAEVRNYRGNYYFTVSIVSDVATTGNSNFKDPATLTRQNFTINGVAVVPGTGMWRYSTSYNGTRYPLMVGTEQEVIRYRDDATYYIWYELSGEEGVRVVYDETEPYVISAKDANTDEVPKYTTRVTFVSTDPKKYDFRESEFPALTKDWVISRQLFDMNTLYWSVTNGKTYPYNGTTRTVAIMGLPSYISGVNYSSGVVSGKNYAVSAKDTNVYYAAITSFVIDYDELGTNIEEPKWNDPNTYTGTRPGECKWEILRGSIDVMWGTKTITGQGDREFAIPVLTSNDTDVEYNFYRATALDSDNNPTAWSTTPETELDLVFSVGNLQVYKVTVNIKATSLQNYSFNYNGGSEADLTQLFTLGTDQRNFTLSINVNDKIYDGNAITVNVSTSVSSEVSLKNSEYRLLYYRVLGGGIEEYVGLNAPTNAGDYRVKFELTTSGAIKYYIDSATNAQTTKNFTISKATFDVSNIKWGHGRAGYEVEYGTPFVYTRTLVDYDENDNVISQATTFEVHVYNLPAGLTITAYENNTAFAAGVYTARFATRSLEYDTENYNAPNFRASDMRKTWEIVKRSFDVPSYDGSAIVFDNSNRAAYGELFADSLPEDYACYYNISTIINTTTRATLTPDAYGEYQVKDAGIYNISFTFVADAITDQSTYWNDERNNTQTTIYTLNVARCEIKLNGWKGDIRTPSFEKSINSSFYILTYVDQDPDGHNATYRGEDALRDKKAPGDNHSYEVTITVAPSQASNVYITCVTGVHESTTFTYFNESEPTVWFGERDPYTGEMHEIPYVENNSRPFTNDAILFDILNLDDDYMTYEGDLEKIEVGDYQVTVSIRGNKKAKFRKSAVDEMAAEYNIAYKDDTTIILKFSIKKRMVTVNWNPEASVPELIVDDVVASAIEYKYYKGTETSNTVGSATTTLEPGGWYWAEARIRAGYKTQFGFTGNNASDQTMSKKVKFKYTIYVKAPTLKTTVVNYSNVDYSKSLQWVGWDNDYMKFPDSGKFMLNDQPVDEIKQAGEYKIVINIYNNGQWAGKSEGESTMPIMIGFTVRKAQIDIEWDEYSFRTPAATVRALNASGTSTNFAVRTDFTYLIVDERGNPVVNGLKVGSNYYIQAKLSNAMAANYEFQESGEAISNMCGFQFSTKRDMDPNNRVFEAEPEPEPEVPDVAPDSDLGKFFKEGPGIQVLVGAVALVLAIVFFAKFLGYMSRVKKAQATAKKANKAAENAANNSSSKTNAFGGLTALLITLPWLGLSNSIWWGIAAALGAFMLLFFILMLVMKSKCAYAEEAAEEALHKQEQEEERARREEERRERDDKEEAQRQRDNEFKMMMMSMMNRQADMQQQAMQQQAQLGSGDVKGMVSDIISALLPAVAQTTQQPLLAAPTSNPEEEDRIKELEARLAQQEEEARQREEELRRQQAEEQARRDEEAKRSQEEFLARQQAMFEKMMAAQQPAQVQVVQVPTEAKEEKKSNDEQLTIERVTLREAYAQLSDNAKLLFDEIGTYVMDKPETFQNEGKYAISFKYRAKPLFKLSIKRGVPTISYSTEGEQLRRLRREAAAETGVSMHFKQSEVPLLDSSTMEVAKGVVDLRISQIDRDIDYAKEQRNAKRRKSPDEN